jgi:hypothetical protein
VPEPEVNVICRIVDTRYVASGDGAQSATHTHAHQAHQAGETRDPHVSWPGRRALAAWFGAFAVYAGVTIITGHADGTWAIWASGGYAVTALLLLLPARLPGFRSYAIPLAAAIGGALIAPLLWLILRAPATGEVVVIGRSAGYLLKHGTPYLPPSMLTSWVHYNPYLPLMQLFGLPQSAGLTGVLADPRIWTTLTTVAALIAAFIVVSPHRVRDCRDCGRRVALFTALAVASPLIAFPLSVGETDPPIIALICLTLALSSRGKLVRAGVVLAVACAMKTTAWAVIPVLAVMAWVRYAPRVAGQFTATAVGLTGFFALLAAPEALATPIAVSAVKQNLIDYPLGKTKYKTPAQSPLLGHLIAELGPVGHAAAIALMVIAVLAFAAWILLRPPRDARDAALRLAVGYAVMFTLDPSTRFGYFTYPLALLGWLALTPRESTVKKVPG